MDIGVLFSFIALVLSVMVFPLTMLFERCRQLSDRCEKKMKSWSGELGNLKDLLIAKALRISDETRKEEMDELIFGYSGLYRQLQEIVSDKTLCPNCFRKLFSTFIAVIFGSIALGAGSWIGGFFELRIVDDMVGFSIYLISMGIYLIYSSVVSSWKDLNAVDEELERAEGIYEELYKYLAGSG